MVRVIYDLAESCTKCPYNHDRICTRLGKYLFDICFEQDCPLPTLEEVEKFTRYITPNKELECHGNCKNWERWEYNKHIKTDLGICRACDVLKFCHANGKSCEEFDELMSEKRFIVVKGCDNNVEKEGYFIQDTHYGVLKFGSFWKEKFAKEDCKRLNDVCELIEELHISDHMGWERAEHFEKELKQKKIYIKRLEYKVQKFKEMNSEQQSTIRKLQDLCGQSDSENAKLRIENKRLQEENEQLKNRLNEEYIKECSIK